MANVLKLVVLAALSTGAMCYRQKSPEVTTEANANVQAHGNTETIHFGSYQPTEHQLEVAKRTIANEETRETMKKLVDILRQSTPDSQTQETIDDYTNEFENKPVADAAFSTGEKEEENVPTTEQHEIHEHSHNEHHSNEALDVVKQMCDLLLRSPEYMNLCKNTAVQDIILKHPNVLDEAYDVKIVGQHKEPTNGDVVSDYKDNHNIDQSMRYVIGKICVGPLPAACQKISQS
ncbi:uncharacterized protein BBOV_IV003120 [Babesia bovis T2Bo]|uniref:Uncharacterized protein n=1 Tax=Babesia bovis TaxID=5865 RepID=A7AVT2_BABBO|nr:uncharacterized protein BBOV_IV003120 [Babesia bovis T2Bo]EDO05908.1 hypothetical protein BBOV_IV003120 [Babesia bovis T2Bo]|eukprot:XP_001609476.1 hypothetical protein [Babesia bovis T2Bo]